MYVKAFYILLFRDNVLFLGEVSRIVVRGQVQSHIFSFKCRTESSCPFSVNHSTLWDPHVRI